MDPYAPKRESLYVNSPKRESLAINEIGPSIHAYTLNIPNSLVSKRPSLDILHDSASVNDLDVIALNEKIPSFDESPVEVRNSELPQQQVKFGWIRGVLIRCILSILGTLIYLRLGWVAGQAGILLGVVIALISTLIVVITALSMCALCTNGEINAGGAYFMLSRSLGPEFGGSMGVVFALADAVACAMNVVGFAESMTDLLKQYNLEIVDDYNNNVRIIGAITLVALFTIVMISVSWEAKVELVLLVIVVISYTAFIVGTIAPRNEDETSKGVTGYKWSTFKENLLPSFRGETFISVFAIYFPSITGIMAGAGISGELKAPDKALPKGTLLGIAITSLVYISAIVLTGSTCLRDASGDISDITGCKEFHNCSYGLINYYNVMALESSDWWFLVTAGTFATSLSSAFTLIVTSPRTIQALTKDRIFPYVSFLSKESGSDREPRIAYCLVLIIGLIIVAIGNLNVIAPLISNFYLASFALINYACFDGSLAKSPNWRPAFKYYNMWVALVGAALCVIAMFVMQYATALATIAVMFFLYVYILRSKPNVNWGSSGQAHMYKNALQYMLSLVYTEEHVKTYRPSILLLSGNPVIRPCLVNFFSNITKGRSLYICGDVFIHPNIHEVADDMKKRSKRIQYFLKKRKIKTFHCPVVAPCTEDGYKSLLQLAGFGKMRPNIVALGFKRNWKLASLPEIEEYFNLIHEIFSQNMGICMLAQKIGFDFSEQIEKGKSTAEYENLLHRGSMPVASISAPNLNPNPDSTPTTPKSNGIFFISNSNRVSPMPSAPVQRRHIPPPLDLNNENRKVQFALENMSIGSMSRNTSFGSLVDSPNPDTPTIKISPPSNGPPRKNTRKKSQFQRELDFALSQFTLPIKRGVVDVWWLFDDGGLTLLLAHLLTTKKSYLSGANLRVFTFAQNVDQVEEEKANLESLLEKFRIKFSEVNVIGDPNKSPAAWTVAEFERIVNKFKIESNDLLSAYPSVMVTDEQLDVLNEKTLLLLRTRDYITELSRDSDLIVITMPVPKKDRETAGLYFAWLEMLTRDLSPYDPPVLLVRGNQENVLTFYS